MYRTQTVDDKMFHDILTAEKQRRPWHPGSDDNKKPIRDGDEYMLINKETKEEVKIVALQNCPRKKDK